MSAPEFRAVLQQRINEALNGEDGASGVRATALGEFGPVPHDYATYRDMVGYIRGLRTVLNKIIPDTWADLYDPKPKDEQKSTPITTPPGAAP